jgi:hypothetical protein
MHLAVVRRAEAQIFLLKDPRLETEDLLQDRQQTRPWEQIQGDSLQILLTTGRKVLRMSEARLRLS